MSDTQTAARVSAATKVLGDRSYRRVVPRVPGIRAPRGFVYELTRRIDGSYWCEVYDCLADARHHTAQLLRCLRRRARVRCISPGASWIVDGTRLVTLAIVKEWRIVA